VYVFVDMQIVLNPLESFVSGESPLVFAIRHSIAMYLTYAECVRRCIPFDRYNQIPGDLTEAGVKLATDTAHVLFWNIKDKYPGVQKIIVLTSNEMRADQTARIYQEIAREYGLDSVNPYMSDKLKDIISVNPGTVLVSQIFSPSRQRVIFDNTSHSSDFLADYDRACDIVDSDNQVSWGTNYAKHSEVIRAIFPEVVTARRSYLRFARLAQLVFDKLKSELDTGIAVLVFGHENYLVSEVQRITDGAQQSVGNCEPIGLRFKKGVH
jgi:hypothetical protein